jgi:hypothetical protein
MCQTQCDEKTGERSYPATESKEVPWVRKFTATPNSPILPLEPIDFLQEGWR